MVLRHQGANNFIDHVRWSRIEMIKVILLLYFIPGSAILAVFKLDTNILQAYTDLIRSGIVFIFSERG